MVGVSTAIVSLVLNDKHKPSAGKPTLEKVSTPKRVVTLAAPSAARVSTDKPVVVHPAPPAPGADTLPEVPNDIPAGADVALVDRWIKLVEDAAQDARNVDNMTAFASLTAKLVSLLEHRRKVTPIPKDDPNDNPDMIALGEQVWQRLQKALDE